MKTVKPITVELTDELILPAYTDDRHEWLVKNIDLTRFIGTARKVLANHKSRHQDEFKEGVHWCYRMMENAAGRVTKQLCWNERGLMKLTSFLKSTNGKSKLFRDWLEEVYEEKHRLAQADYVANTLAVIEEQIKGEM